MSACAEFAEHVWKPGSCKNCFHPRSAHGQSGPLLEDEDGLSSPSPYSKPTIAVRPTMMNTDTSTDINMNTEQASQMSSVGLKKAVDLPPLFMDNNGCHRTLLIQNSSISGIKEYSNVSTAGYSKECMIISNMFMSEEDSGRRQNKTLHSTFMNSVSHRHLSTGETDVSLRQEERQMSAVNRLNRTSQESSPDSCLSDGSSLDSFTSPQNSPDSASAPPDRPKETEPIYAESTKRKCRPAEDVKSRPEVCENQRATITVMAAHTEENNLTFYLSSPDSAVSTQWTHFSPKEASVPAFTWPDTLSPAPSSQSKPQSSPPVPPKIHTRSPRLGTSSLTPLPELSFHVSPNDIAGIPPPADSQSEHKSLSLRSLDGRIDEEDEEHEREEGTSDAINECAVWKSRPRESSEDRTTPGTNNSIQTQKLRVVSSSSLLELNTGLEPPPPPPKKHHRVCNRLSVGMDLERIIQQGSVENLSQSLQTLHFCTTNTSTDSLHTLTDTDSTLRSCPSPLSSSPLASAPASPQPDVFPSNSLVHQLQPPPLPQKKLVNRTVSAPSQSGVKPLVRARPRLPFGGSDINVSRPDADGRPSSPTCSSGESVERRPPLRSRTLDEPQFKGQGRLGGHSRGSITSSSSPQLNILLSPSPSVTSSSTLQLQTLLNNMDSREGIYSKLGGLYAESLRRLALKCEVHFTSTQRNPLRFNESNWSLFKLTCNKPSCVSGDAVYYSASCASDVRNTYAVKICKGQTSDSKQCHLYGLSVQQNVPPHFNLQQDCGHFIACVPQSMLPSEENLSGSPRPVEQERVVVITQDVPHQSAADFVREWESFHRAQPEVYERRVCFLLLQLCTGLEHIKSHGVTHRDLCLENLLLVQHRRSDGGLPDPQQQCLPRLLISNFAKAKRRSSDDSTVSADPRLKRDHARLAPEIVSAAQYRKFDEFQTGILIYELLHQRNPFELTPALRQQEYRCKDLPSIPNVSIYSGGLQRLAHLLLEPDPGRRIHIQDAKRVLQGLLWGPRRDLLEQPWVYGGGVERPGHEGLLNWLDVKRALLMMKFAERSLEPERNAELEDWLCCQYFSAANPKSLCQTAELLYNLKFTH